MEGNTTLIIIALFILVRVLANLFKQAPAKKEQQQPFRQAGFETEEEMFASTLDHVGGQAAPREAEKVVYPSPLKWASEPEKAVKIDPWGFDRYDDQEEEDEGYSPQFAAEAGKERQAVSEKSKPGPVKSAPTGVLSLTRPAKVTRSSPAPDLLGDVFARDRFLSAFLLHEILEPPKALKRGSRII